MSNHYETKFLAKDSTPGVHRRQECFDFAEKLEEQLESILTANPNQGEKCQIFEQQIQKILEGLSLDELAKMNNDTEVHAAVELAYSRLFEMQKEIDSTFSVDEKEELEDK